MTKKSIAWKFFDISTTPHMSKCKLCDSLVTRGGKSFKSYGTTAMVKHLRLKHSKEFELAEEKKKVQSLPFISEASVASTSNTVQSDHRSIRIHKIIEKLITLDIQPFSILEDKGITGHWIDQTKFFQETAVLRVIHFPEKHTGVHIKKYLQKGLETFEIPLSNIHLIVTDNASNMKAAVKNSGMSSIPCFIHTFQLCIHDSIFSQETINEILTLCRGITTHFNHSPIACAKLKLIQQQLSTVPHKMKQDVPTRWNSSFEMLQRTFEQKVPLAIYAAKYMIKLNLLLIINGE
ncbi:zinc finger BED domain-containing protein 4-like isoform X1 [Hydra vulgaris]|uniref:zinc finger BED domain-containing protein 4-like isoform X1 n=1 Tax=Hydra vulgaris TaxID=6087 RepID=UPI001F5EDA08|nr:zinc finger BED domain-containing protein 4-like [Hydra vulgaris]